MKTNREYYEKTMENGMIFQSSLTTNEKLVLNAITAFDKPLTEKQISKVSKISEEEVCKSISTMVEDGYISVEIDENNELVFDFSDLLNTIMKDIIGNQEMTQRLLNLIFEIK